jgi:hypothetical protein
MHIAAALGKPIDNPNSLTLGTADPKIIQEEEGGAHLLAPLEIAARGTSLF